MQQFDEKKFKPPAPSWYDLKQLPRSSDGDVWDRERQHEFRSKIQLRVYYDAASYASDLQPSALPLRSQAIGVLEQPASGQRSAPMAGEGPSTPTASPWAAAGLALDTGPGPVQIQNKINFN